MAIHSVILCSRNRPHELADVLRQVCRLLPADGHVIVVEASDPDLKLDAAVVAEVGRTVIRDTCAPGLTRQRNVALTHVPCDTNIIHFLDDDIVIEDDYFLALEREFDAHPEAAGIGVRTSDNVERSPSRLQRIFLLDTWESGRLLKSGINVGYKDRGTYRVDWLPGCAMAFRPTALTDVRFDEKRQGVGWGEDVDISLKASTSGPLYITSTTHVVHLRSPLNRDADSVRDRESFRNRLYLADDFPRRVSRTAIRWSFIGQSVIAAGQHLRGRTHGVLAAVKSAGRALVLLLRSLLNWLRGLGGLLVAPLRGLRAYRRMTRELDAPTAGATPVSESDAQPVAVMLQGGLGNQLFGFSAGLAQARRLRTSLVLDTSSFSPNNPRAFELDWLLGDDTRLGSAPRGRHELRESGFAFDERVMHVRPGTTLVGYFQSWRYFEEIDKELRALILERASTLPTAGPAGTSSFIGVQVRRGDYLDAHAMTFHGLCSLEYYRRGLDLCRSVLGPLPARVFSDDPEAGAEVAMALDDAVVDTPDPDEPAVAVLTRLSDAAAIVISNSSFGWWAGWLAGPGTTVVAPRPWFSDRSMDTADLLPTEWIAVDRGA